jgi:hypothetical protein
MGIVFVVHPADAVNSIRQRAHPPSPNYGGAAGDEDPAAYASEPGTHLFCRAHRAAVPRGESATLTTT